LIFFGSFLYQDKKERVNGSLPCFSFAMQWFSVVLWKRHCVHRYTCGSSHGVTNISPLRGWGRRSLFVDRDSLFVNAILCNTVLHCVTLWYLFSWRLIVDNKS
jgi:hypothetical protein